MAAPMAAPVGRARAVPDLVIPGTPRSGTTFMYQNLGLHPQIYMSPRKEPSFFATDLDSGSYLDSIAFMRDRERYLALFDGARPDQLTGEASPWYLYSHDAAANIHAWNPQARIVAMLREPVAMLHSLYLRRVYGGAEDISTFEEALAAEDDRRSGRRIPAGARNLKAFYYREVGRYASQVERFIDQFGPRQVLVVIFEEMSAEPAATYRRVLEFLDVDPDFEPEFRVVNAARIRSGQRLHRKLFSPTGVRGFRRVVPPRYRPAVGRAFDRISTRRQRVVSVDPSVARRLRAELQPDVERLEQIIDRDLSRLWPLPD